MLSGSGLSSSPPSPPTMRWVPHEQSPTDGLRGLSRSGHSAVLLHRRGALVLFGGLQDKDFLGDCLMLDIISNRWRPVASLAAGAPAPLQQPLPRAFHCAATNSTGHMFIFGGRHGRRRLADFWMLDSDTWQWVELPCTGDQPSARDFATLVAFEGFFILHGGWDGAKFLNDTYILDTSSLEWRQVSVAGALPAARCGHTATIVEKRMLILGGRGTGGAMLGDLWALRDFIPSVAPEQPEASWTQLRLPGTPPAARCGHAAAAARNQVLVFGGHSQGGWLARVDTYLNDVTVLDRASVQWRTQTVAGRAPAPRAYHTLTRLDNRYLCVGGFDGKVTFGDAWWLLPADDPQALRHEEAERRGLVLQQATASLPVSSTAGLVPKSPLKTEATHEEEENKGQQAALAALRARLGLGGAEPLASPALDSAAAGVAKPLEVGRAAGALGWRPGDDPERVASCREQLQALGVQVLGQPAPLPTSTQGEVGLPHLTMEGSGSQAPARTPSAAHVEPRTAARKFLASSPPASLTMDQLAVLFDDYRAQVAAAHLRSLSVQQPMVDAAQSNPQPLLHSVQNATFYHLSSCSELQVCEVAALQGEYKKLLQQNEELSETSLPLIPFQAAVTALGF